MSKNNSNFQKMVICVLLPVLLVSGCGPLPGAQDAMAVYSSGILQANQIKIAYESYGPTDRESILLIGGTGNQLIDWPIELVKELVGRGYRVIRFDNRDAGLSTIFSEAGYPDYAAVAAAMTSGKPASLPYTLEDMAADAVGLLEALQIPKAHIVGVSMGGAIAQIVALKYPEHTLSLTSLMADSGNPALPVSAKPKVLAAIPQMPAEGDREAYIAYNVKVAQVIGSPNYPTDEATLREQAKLDVERSYQPVGLLRQQIVALMGHLSGRNAQLKNIHVPTVVLQGSADPLVPVEAAQEIANNIPGAELILIKGLGHDLPVQLVGTIADAIIKAARGPASQ